MKEMDRLTETKNIKRGGENARDKEINGGENEIVA